MTAVFDRVRKLGLKLDGVEVGTSYGAPALKVRDQFFVGIPTNKSAEPDSIVARLSFTERDLRLRAEPAIYYIKPHYEGYPSVLARVKLMDDDALAELLETSWQFVRTTRKTRR
jgi:hypothetical protein